MVYLIVLYYYNQYINIDYVISFKKMEGTFYDEKVLLFYSRREINKKLFRILILFLFR